MPVARYNPGQVQGKSLPFVSRGAKALGNQGGAAIVKTGQALAGFGGQIYEHGMELQERQDKAAAKSAFVEFGDRVRAIQTSYQSLKMQNAMGSTTKATREIDELQDKMLGNLANDTQRDLFYSLSNTRRSSFLDSQALYEKRQLQEWEKTSSNLMADEAIQYAAENYEVPGAIADAKTKIDIAITTGMQGADAESIRSVKEAKITKMHQAVVNYMAIDNAAGAKEYYEKYKSEIDGTARQPIEAMLKNAGVKQQSQINADKIMASGVSYTEQLKKARAIKDPEVRDATVSRVKVRHDEEEAIKKENRQKTIDNKMAVILEHHENKGTYEEAIDIALSVPNGSDQAKLRKTVQFLYMKEDAITYPDKFVELMERVDKRSHRKGPINSLEQIYTEYKPYLSNSDFDRGVKYWQDGGAAGGLKDSRVKSIYKSLTGKDPNKSKTQSKKYKDIWDYVINNLPEGKTPTDEEIKKLIVQATIDGERRGGGIGYGDDTTYLEALREGYSNTWLPDVVSDEREQIKTTLRANEEPVSEFMIRLYKRIYILELPYTMELKKSYEAEKKRLGGRGSNVKED